MNNVFSSLDLKFFNSFFFDPWFFSLIIFVFFLFEFFPSLLGFGSMVFFKDIFNVSHLFFYKGVYGFLFYVFFFIFFCNISGLFPYFFGLTSHLFVNLIFSVVLFFSICLLLVFSDFVGYFSHFIPFGSGFLSGFLAYIEFVSFWVRMLTLTLRLSVNMTAGHVFLHLLGSSSASFFSFVFFLLLVFYFLFEFFVGFIQSVVYCLLVSCYLTD